MTTITLQIDESTAKGQALLAFIKAYHTKAIIHDEHQKPPMKEIIYTPVVKKVKDSDSKIHKTMGESGEDIFYDASVWEEIE